jgi:hypothetical protein
MRHRRCAASGKFIPAMTHGQPEWKFHPNLDQWGCYQYPHAESGGWHGKGGIIETSDTFRVYAHRGSDLQCTTHHSHRTQSEPEVSSHCVPR